MPRKLRTYNTEEKPYRDAMKRARVDSTSSLAVIIEGFVTAYGNYSISASDVNDYISQLPKTKKKAK